MTEVDWDRRAEIYGRKAVMDLSLRENEAAALTQLQEEIILHRLDRALQYRYNGWGLDFGCGVGRFTQHLAMRCERLVCYDPSRKLLEMAVADNAKLSKEKIVWTNHFAGSGPIYRWVWITLVLGNVPDEALSQLAFDIGKLVDMGGVVLFAEHISETDRGSDFWRFRRRDEYMALFPGMKTRMVDQYMTRGNTVGVFEAIKQ